MNLLIVADTRITIVIDYGVGTQNAKAAIVRMTKKERGWFNRHHLRSPLPLSPTTPYLRVHLDFGNMCTDSA